MDDFFDQLSNLNKASSFDKFEPYEIIQKQDFAFKPTRYETWMGGKVIASGKTNSIITAKAVYIDGEEKMEVSFDDVLLNTELASKNIFDMFLTSTDRLQLITIPNETNHENVAIMMFKMTVGATRQSKNFKRNEPYCCNLFMLSGAIAKITFSYSNPEKLIEFYSELENEEIDLEFVFHSSDHLRYENGMHVSGKAIQFSPKRIVGKRYHLC